MSPTPSVVFVAPEPQTSIDLATYCEVKGIGFGNPEDTAATVKSQGGNVAEILHEGKFVTYLCPDEVAHTIDLRHDNYDHGFDP